MVSKNLNLSNQKSTGVSAFQWAERSEQFFELSVFFFGGVVFGHFGLSFGLVKVKLFPKRLEKQIHLKKIQKIEGFTKWENLDLLKTPGKTIHPYMTWENTTKILKQTRGKSQNSSLHETRPPPQNISVTRGVVSRRLAQTDGSAANLRVFMWKSSHPSVKKHHLNTTFSGVSLEKSHVCICLCNLLGQTWSVYTIVDVVSV